MRIKVYFSEEDRQRDDFDDFKSAVLFYLSRIQDFVDRFWEKTNETQKEKACNKGVRKQRWNKTVNASKSS